MDLRILTTTDPEVGFTLQNQQTLVSGKEGLFQEVVIELLSDPNPLLARGAGLKTIIEQSSPADKAATKGMIATAVISAKTHILANHQEATQLTAEERLADLRLLSATSQNGVEWAIELEIVTADGEATQTQITL